MSEEQKPVQPVAWIHPQYGHMQARTETMSPEVVASYERGGWMPLYTAPPQPAEPVQPVARVIDWDVLGNPILRWIEKPKRCCDLFAAPPQRKPLRTVTYVCPVCAASLERQE